MTIKAIETNYAGCRFRSRLEARWAVFFDVLGIRWEYEPKGFTTAHGPYLPDFRLPDLRLYIEIKGSEPTQRDLDRCAEISEATQRQHGSLTILQGDVPRSVENLLWLEWMPEPDGTWQLRGWYDARCPFYNPDHGMQADEVNRALTAARSARFEHGESGAPRAGS